MATLCVSLFLFLFFLGGCDSKESSYSVGTGTDPGSSSTVLPSSSTIQSNIPRIVAFGDSLTAGLGVAADQTYPAQLDKLLKAAGYHYEVINAGVSGETTAGGLRRVDWILKSRPSIVIVELGANDALRGQPISSMAENLDHILTRLRESGTLVILAGMKIPPNYGEAYTREFSAMYETLAHKHGIPLIPFFLDGVAARPELNQADGIHPTAEGYTMIAQTVFKALKPLLEKEH